MAFTSPNRRQTVDPAQLDRYLATGRASDTTTADQSSPTASASSATTHEANPPKTELPGGAAFVPAAAEQPFPWTNSDPRMKRQVMLNIPEHEFFMLKWLAQTTYGLSQNQLILQAIRKEIALRMTERELSVMFDENGMIKLPVLPAPSK